MSLDDYEQGKRDAEYAMRRRQLLESQMEGIGRSVGGILEAAGFRLEPPYHWNS